MNNIVEHLRNVRLFAELSDVQLERIAAACRRRVYRGKVHLFYQGDPGGQLYIVLNGGVKIYSESEDGTQETTLALFTAGDVFGEMPLLTGGERTASAITVAEETELLLLDQASFHALLRDCWDLTKELLRTLALRLTQMNENLVQLAASSSMARVAKLLLARADERTGQLCPPLSQEEIANLIGVRRETVARNLARLEQSNCLKRNRGNIVVTSRDILDKIARTS